ncbi:MAG: thiamine diphosphokinase [Acidimicrobiales bacterium]
MSLFIVVAAGESTDASIAARLPTADAVIAADGGLDQALKLGLEPTMLVGDLDSISAEGLKWAQDRQLPIERHPQDKDATDLELALRIATEQADEVVVVDSGAGRFDHALGNLLLLGSSRWAAVELSAIAGGGLVTVVRRHRVLSGRAGDIVSLFAVGGGATGVTTTGLRWALEGAEVQPCSSLGTSNEMTGTEASVSVSDGVVFVLQPLGSAASGGPAGALAREHDR